jgi:hypothetical protein
VHEVKWRVATTDKGVYTVKAIELKKVNQKGGTLQQPFSSTFFYQSAS